LLEEIILRPLRERQAEIKTMATVELQRQYDEGHFGELRPFASAELSARNTEHESARFARTEARETESLSIAREANAIARSALHNSRMANVWAAIAALIAAVAMYIAYSAR